MLSHYFIASGTLRMASARFFYADQKLLPTVVSTLLGQTDLTKYRYVAYKDRENLRKN